MADISFVTLTWNSKQYVGDCLTSIIAQGAAEDLRVEIIIVDNGSTDGTVDIIHEHSARFPDHIRLIALGRNQGTTYPRNLALKQVRSPFVCIIDSDTEFLSGAIRPVLTLPRHTQQPARRRPFFSLSPSHPKRLVRRRRTPGHRPVRPAGQPMSPLARNAQETRHQPASPVALDRSTGVPPGQQSRQVTRS